MFCTQNTHRGHSSVTLGIQIRVDECYKWARSNVVSITRAWVGVNFPENKRYVICNVRVKETTARSYLRAHRHQEESPHCNRSFPGPRLHQ